MGKDGIGWFVILVVVVVAIFWVIPSIRSHDEASKSNVLKLSECKRNAGELYDSERNLIATKNPDVSTHAYYYQVSEQAYATDLKNCQELYGN